METSLHRDLKSIYAGDEAQTEVRLENFRIDAVVEQQLIEIQHSDLAAIRDKIRALCRTREVLVVKPLVASKLLVKRSAPGGDVVDRRRSPKRGRMVDVFNELVHFTSVFPHPNLSLEIAMVEVEEWRYPGHGRRRRRRENDFQVEDQKLLKLSDRRRLATAADLWTLLPGVDLPAPFHTGDLVETLGVRRRLAERIAYVLRETGAVNCVGKQGNSLLYAAPAA